MADVQVPKKPWKSLTTYAAILIAALGGAQMTGALPEGTSEAVQGLMASVLGLVALFGRARAKGPLTL